MLTYAGRSEIFPITPEFAAHLGSGFEMLHDEILDAAVEIRRSGHFKDTTLYERIPVSAKLKADQFPCSHFLIALNTLAFKVLTPPPAALASRAEELLLWWSLTLAQEYAQTENAWTNELEALFHSFTDSVYYDIDFRFLYEPEHDGIEKLMSDMGSLRIEHWFLPFHKDLPINPLTWPSRMKFWHENWSDFEYPE